MSNQNTKLADKLFEIANLIVQREKKPLVLETGETLYRFEIHIIDMIGRNEGINIISLAEKMNVTKGAISQIIKKLVGKKFVKRLKAEDNQKEVLLYLTQSGKLIYLNHLKFHQNMNQKIIDLTVDYEKSEIEKLSRFLEKIIDILKI